MLRTLDETVDEFRADALLIRTLLQVEFEANNEVYKDNQVFVQFFEFNSACSFWARAIDTKYIKQPARLTERAELYIKTAKQGSKSLD